MKKKLKKKKLKKLNVASFIEEHKHLLSGKFNSTKSVAAVKLLRLPDPCEVPPHVFMERFQEGLNGIPAKIANSVRGTSFEIAIAMVLMSRNVPFKWQDDFDIKCLKIDLSVKVRPSGNCRVEWFCISSKTSTRERWRQYQYEANLLKHHGVGSSRVYFLATYGAKLRNAKGELITKNPPETNMPDVNVFIPADDPEFSKVVDKWCSRV